MNTTTLEGFRLEFSRPLKEISCTLNEYIHEKSGAKVLHVDADDPQNVFAILFQTTPGSSNGVAHILEHCVLCGSKNYPIKDPFFEMTRRSLNTFMNAFTGSDFTCYPAASQIQSDFYNLLSVYSDCAFKPLLTRESFLQEGWRYDFENEKLTYKGIVFNEMKGQMSSPGYRLTNFLYEKLFPTLTYGINSGGDPKNIPELTYEEFVAFWNDSYHPSRAEFFFYGNFPIEGHLKFLNENVLKDVDPLPPKEAIPRERRLKAPLKETRSYSSLEKDAESMMSIGWLTCHILEQKEVLALSILESVLTESDASPLRKVLIDSGLCTYVNSSIDNDISEVPFILQIQGCKEENADAIEKLTIKTLHDLVKQGVPKRLIENAFHQIELERTEITNDGLPYGLSLFFRSSLLSLHKGDPAFGLQIHSLFEEIREDLKKNPRYFEDLLQKYFVDNAHRVTVVLAPSTTLEQEELKEELATLEKKELSLSSEEREAIVAKAKELAEFQEREESVECLPAISLNEVPKAETDYPLTTHLLDGLTVYHHETFTNDIVYTDLVYKLPEIQDKHLPYVRFFGMLLGQVGTESKSWDTLLEEIDASTGGFWAALSTNTHATDPQIYTPTLHLRAKALARNVEKMINLTKEIATSTIFSEKERIKDIIQKHATLLQNNLASHSLKYAINLGSSFRTPTGKLNMSWFGLEHFKLTEKLASDFDAHSSELFEALETLKQALLCLENPHLVLTCSQKNFDQLMENQFYGLSKLPKKPCNPFKKLKNQKPVTSCCYPIPASIAYNVRTINTIPYTHPDAPLLALASNIYGNEVLHARIREQGGAYGSGASSSSFTGTLTFYSYRDPNISATYNAFEEAVEKLSKGDVSDECLDEAKREMIQGLDHPTTPGNRAEIAYAYLLDGRSFQARQAYRDRILNATLEEVIRAADTHIKSQFAEAVDISFAGKELLEKENVKTPEYSV